VSRVLKRNHKSQEVKDLGWELKIPAKQKELGVEMGQGSWVGVENPSESKWIGSPNGSKILGVNQESYKVKDLGW